MPSMCVSTLPLQHEELGELSELLCSVEALLSSEREASERRAREEEEKVTEQLSLLQQELDHSRREQVDLEEQMRLYKEQTQQVEPRFPLSHDQLFNRKSEVFPSNLFSHVAAKR